MLQEPSLIHHEIGGVIPFLGQYFITICPYSANQTLYKCYCCLCTLNHIALHNFMLFHNSMYLLAAVVVFLLDSVGMACP